MSTSKEALRLLDSKPWREQQPPDEVLAVPTMLSEQERALLYLLARDYVEPGAGAIVDAGCFLGGSTVSLLAGLRDRPGGWSDAPLHTFDRFRVEDYTKPEYFADTELEVGDSFRARYDSHLAPFKDVPHVTHEGDFAATEWRGGPIQLLFVDVLKNWELADAFQRTFLPHVIPGRTLLVHQDYGWGHAPWIQLGVELMWDSLRFIDSMPVATHLFLVEKSIPLQAVDTNLKELPFERQLRLLESAHARWEPRTAAMVQLSKAMLLDEHDLRDEAVALVRSTRAATDDPLVRQCADAFAGWMPEVAVSEPSPDPAFVLGARAWRQRPAPDEVLAVPSMLSEQERALLYVLARDYVEPGAGAIVDAGCFLGGSTVSLLAGLRDRDTAWSGPPVASFDLFEVEQYTKPTFFADCELRVGDSFRALYNGHVSGFADMPHVTHEGDIATIGWSGGPIQLLFVDVLKSWALTDAFAHAFLTHVVPGRTVLVHQDYGFGYHPWVHLSVELMWDSLRFLDSMPYGTHAFLVEKPIPREAIETDLRMMPFERKLQLMDRARGRWSPPTASMVDLGKAILLAERGLRREASALVSATRAASNDVSVQQCAQALADWIPTVAVGPARIRRWLRRPAADLLSPWLSHASEVRRRGAAGALR